MCNANAVKKAVKRAVKDSRSGRITAASAEELKRAVGAEDMRTPHFQQVLATLKHQKQLRGFSLSRPAYIQG